MAEMTAAQAQIIELHSKNMFTVSEVIKIVKDLELLIEQQAQEIERKDRMLKLACDDKKETLCTNCGAKEYCDDVGDGIDCNIVFYGWLEKRSAGGVSHV